MYQEVDGTLVITVNDWVKAGLTYKQFNHDSYRGFLKIFRRGILGNTLIDVKSIKKQERIMVLEMAYGEINEDVVKSIYDVEVDTEARAYFIDHRKSDGSPLDPENIEKYTNRAYLLNALKSGLKKQVAAKAKAGKRIKKAEFWKLALKFYKSKLEEFPSAPITNERSLKRIFEEYIDPSGGYYSIIHKNEGNDSARKVSVSIERLLLAIWRMNDKPFVNRVHEIYLEFVVGNKELYDTDTGEWFLPANFRHKDRAMEISVATVWNYLKDIVNETSVYEARNGNFDYMNHRRPKHRRKLGQYSLSKISMDDVAMSRKSVRGWVFKYIAVDVVSGYYFRPAYVVGKPTINTIIEAFRNMFIELHELGLPMPGELEVEHALMQHIEWLSDLFPFVRFAKSSTDKRAEHKIRSLKWGAAKKAGHTRGRWYAKHEAYRSVRNKVKGDYVEPEYQPQTIVADDLADIVTHDNTLHPLQKTYPRMTRKQVLLSQINPNLKPIERWHLYKFIGNKTDTTIYNNDYCPVNLEVFELATYDSLNRLKSNNNQVTAYWLPEADGSVASVYLYQGDTYIGEAVNAEEFRYNENAIERKDNAEEEAKILHQQKRATKFDNFIKERRQELPKIGIMDAEQSKEIEALTVELVENPQPKGYETDAEDEYGKIDWAETARQSL
ncbi:MAG: hypothetical protein QM500_21040 [Methylococcales bacterium]